MEWSNSLEIGVKYVDEQHKQIIDRMHNIVNAGINGTAEKEILPLLIFLKEYVIKHFDDEEKLQRESKYPKYEQHKMIHKQFMKEVDKLYDKFDKEGVTLTVMLDTNKTVADLFINHINKVDKEFAAYYKTINN